MTRIGIRSAVKILGAASLLLSVAIAAQAADKKPNILVVWGDDIGRDNISAYSMGVMGYQTRPPRATCRAGR